MNNVSVPDLDLVRWIGSIAVILESLITDPFFGCVSGALLVCAALLIFYRLTSFGGADK